MKNSIVDQWESIARDAKIPYDEALESLSKYDGKNIAIFGKRQSSISPKIAIRVFKAMRKMGILRIHQLTPQIVQEAIRYQLKSFRDRNLSDQDFEEDIMSYVVGEILDCTIENAEIQLQSSLSQIVDKSIIEEYRDEVTDRLGPLFS